MAADTYFLGLSSHKGGTGRTTAVLALAWALGRQGIQCGILDADPVGAATLLALDESGQCPYQNVRLLRADDQSVREWVYPIVLVDCPALTDHQSDGFLEQLDGVLLTGQADPLALRTTPSAVRAIQSARQHNRRLSFMGLLISHFAADDPTQQEVMEQLKQQHQTLLWEPVVPYEEAWNEWAEISGQEPPTVVAQSVYEQLAEKLAQRLDLRPASASRPRGLLRMLLGI